MGQAAVARTVPEEESAYECVIVDPRRVRPMPGQPRQWFDAKRLNELALSIKHRGQKQAVTLKKVSGDPKHDYELVDGERRWRACMLLKKWELLAIIKPIADGDDQFISGVIANFGSEGHQPLEIAQAISRMLEMPQFAAPTKTERIVNISHAFARSTAWIYQHLNLMTLHPEVQALLEPTVPEKSRLNISVAIALNSVADQDLQLSIAKAISSESMSLGRARLYIRQRMAEAGLKPAGRPRVPSDDFANLETLLERISDGSELVTSMKMHVFVSLFKRRHPQTRRQMHDKLKEGIEALTNLMETMGHNLDN